MLRASLLQVRYLPDQFTFNNKNLEVSIQLNGNTVVWQPIPGVNATLNGNLLGTIRVRCSCGLKKKGGGGGGGRVS